MTTKIFIDGNAGTTGLQIAARLAARSDLRLIQPEEARRKDPEARAECLGAADVAILCLPDDAAKEAVAIADSLGSEVRFIDASTAHRTHSDWIYGFPEWEHGHAARIAKAKRVSNPGCYSTGAIALLHPLAKAGLLPADYPVSINAVSGYSGGGRQMIEKFETAHPEGVYASAFHVYGLGLEHKHVPEIVSHGGLAARPIFVPSVGRFAQGMIVQIPLHFSLLPGSPTATRLHEALSAHYDGCAFVTVMPALSDASSARLVCDRLVGTNRMELHVFGNDRHGQAVLVAVLDNLGKGASGAAVQNLNIILGAPEGLGL